MRDAIALLILIVAAADVYCAWISSRSEMDIAPKVTHFLISLLPPVVGNLIIIVAHTEGFSLFGRYLYATGIDITMYCLLDFTLQYCGLKWNKTLHRITVACVALDIGQLLCNPFFGHAFAPDRMMAYGAPYYNVKSYFGRNIHLALVYLIMAVVLAILITKSIRGARIYSEKYSIICLLLLFTGVWEVFYIFSRTPVKRSVIAYGVFGILVFYFSLYYRPMRLLDHLLADVASRMTDGLFFFDENGKCVWADDHGFRLIGIRSSDSAHIMEKLNELFPGLELEKSDWVCRRSLKDRYYDLAKHVVYDNRRAIGSVLSVQDETEDEIALLQERYLATHDSLTGLYTKVHLFHKIRERIDSNPDKIYYAVFMDIDNFKLVNDVFGLEFGDYALKAWASDLRTKLPKTSVFGRIGGDTFGAFLPEDEFDPDLAEKYMSEFAIEKDGISHWVVIHEGVYRVTDRSIDVSVMFDRAHMALETIKGDSKKHVALYDEVMRDKVIQGQSISNQIAEALEKRQICPYLQVIVDRDGKAVGAEALVRWMHPEKGFLSPGDFIPVIESNGMIADVDRSMWRYACEILKRWGETGREDLFVSVNISPKDFFFMDVYEELCSIVAEYDIPPSRLRVEITETIMMNDRAGKFDLLRNLRRAGFIVEMDDFGSGYSSLNMLKNMPVDVIKLDMMFLDDMEDLSRTSAILRNVINMMIELGLVPLTEGVETEEQYRLLSQMGCVLFQGYLFDRPLPVEQFEAKYLKR